MDLLERTIYHVPDPPRQPRQRPMKVLALGFSRSGTESLSRALQTLGYEHVFHGWHVWQSRPMLWRAWAKLIRRKYGADGTVPGDTGLTRDDFDAYISQFEAVTDLPWPTFAREMIAAYPEARVVLNRRSDVDAWYRSYCTVLKPLTSGLFYHVFPWFQADLYWTRRFVDELLKPYFYGSWERHGKWVYEEHSAMVRGLVPGDNLLEWGVEEGWGPLCEFLDKETPAEEFPSGNTPEYLKAAYEADLMPLLVRAQRNIAISVGCLCVIGALLVKRPTISWDFVRNINIQAYLRR
ncbi:hypothetical protein ASPSYDRAFT_59741 [Aspergillus sydowii CBS 593.65]|uniref:Uncharacterized protein n=1 Tax=Aspergillus sydowii CBS 593.65 TaxID=1036612 RepID=A0A1L9TAI7_9EURO|nr:uncharacterized protein ASPSYDRAFT_59741 [Aspergillus sydowii CBS 593.65]OJJ56434.1 hypothetical protein ASPSYDRAFT_59741 [Aspergillus sydowii CBS 593.65]